MPWLHFHPFCVLISTIHSFGIDINLMAIYWYFSVTYLAECNYQQREADRCDVRAASRVSCIKVRRRYGLGESNGSQWSPSKRSSLTPSEMNLKRHQWNVPIGSWPARWQVLGAVALPPLVLNSGRVHNNACVLPAVCHSCNLSFGYSYSHSMVLWAQQLIPQEKADLC